MTMRRPSPFRVKTLFGLFIVSYFVWQFFVGLSLTSNSQSRANDTPLVRIFLDSTITVKGPCAINLYGLPRSFQDLVLPSLIKNVIITNARYHCDYFVHYHNRTHEPPGRDGRGGFIQPDEIVQIKNAILEVARHTQPQYVPTVRFTSETESEFRRKRGSLLDQLYTQKDANGNWLYIPVNHPSYNNETIDNVIKMWHGQEMVWKLMESHKHYSRVAILRNDVVYVTPIDVYRLPDGSLDSSNEFAVIPDFAKHPVNDRLMHGPYDALKIFAAGRFQRLEQHISLVQRFHPGDGIHSERFLAYTIFPAIRDAGVPIVADQNMCFLRARADRSIRFDDCGWEFIKESNQVAIEQMIHRKCLRNMTDIGIVHLDCAI